jgi:hypothetical protein
MEYLGAFGGDSVLRSKEVAGIAVPADGEYGRVFEQQQVIVVGPALYLSLVEGPLQVPCLGISKTPQPAGSELRYAN